MTAAPPPALTVTESFDFAGAVDIAGRIDPVSLQASPSRKRAFRESVSAAVEAHSSGVFLGDVSFEFEWYVPEDVRYLTHSIADLDNVLKPLIDALTGPNRVMVDDNQVQSVSAAWMTAGIDLVFRARLKPGLMESYRPRDGLYFVEVAPGRCFPLFERYRGKWNDGQVAEVQRLLGIEKAMIDEGYDPEVARAARAVQRTFPRGRLRGFKVEAP